MNSGTKRNPVNTYSSGSALTRDTLRSGFGFINLDTLGLMQQLGVVPPMG